MASAATGPVPRRGGTRERLIAVAIELIAERGFAGTTMRLVADAAGVTQGPRQYYFPSTTSLYAAVVDAIHARSDAGVAAFEALRDLPLPARTRAIAEGAFRTCGDGPHLAMIELKMACRGDAALREAIEGKILTTERRYDEAWVRIFADTGRDRDHLIELRTIVSATLRGYGIALATGEAETPRDAMAARVASLLEGSLRAS